MRTIGGILLGILLFYPGIELLRFVMVRVLGVYDAMTLTDGCLLMIMILLCVHLVRSRTRAAGAKATHEHEYGEPQAQLHYLPSERAGRAPAPRRRTATKRRSTRPRE